MFKYLFDEVSNNSDAYLYAFSSTAPKLEATHRVRWIWTRVGRALDGPIASRGRVDDDITVRGCRVKTKIKERRG